MKILNKLSTYALKPSSFCGTSMAVALLIASSAVAAPPVPEVLVINDETEPVPVTGTVSVSESLSDNVVLAWRTDTEDVCNPFSGTGVGHLLLDDRSVAEDPFTVPDGKLLVINHISWNAWDVVGSFAQGDYISVTVGPREWNLLRTGTVVTADIAVSTYAAGNENINGGMIFRPGEIVCMTSGLRTGSTTNAGPTLNGSTLTGRLVDQ